MNDSNAVGFLNFFPIAVEADINSDGFTFGLVPWGTVSLLAVTGSLPATPSEAALAIAYEWPIPAFPPLMDKHEMELLHVRRFMVDHLRATGRSAFEIVQQQERPDFLVKTDSGPVGLEYAVLTPPTRRDIYGLFGAFRRQLEAQSPTRFTHLVGCNVIVWFEVDDWQPGKPFRKNDQRAIDELIEALAAHRPDPAGLAMRDIPQHFDASYVRQHRTAAGATFIAIPFTNAAPSTSLAMTHGFEMGVVYSTTHSASDVWNTIERVVHDHDQPGVDWLLLSVGAPNEKGVIFPSEAPFVNLAFLTKPGIVPPVRNLTPRHIKRVTLHWWQAGQSAELMPTGSEPFGPLYQGLIIPCYPFMPVQDQQPPEAASAP